MIHFLHNTVGVFHIYVFVNTGSINEDKSQRGISHMLEHMLFKQSKNMSTDDILKEATKLGGDFNAATDKDLTFYYFKTTTDMHEKAVRVIAEILTSPSITPKGLDSERAVVIEELQKGLDSDDRMLWHLSTISTLSPTHPYSLKVIGTKSALMNLTTDDLKDYFNDHYKDYTIVVNCEAQIAPKVKKLIEKLFKGYLSGKTEACEVVSGVPLEVERKVIVFKKNLNQTNILLTFPYFAHAMDLKQVMILEFLSFVLSGAGLYSLLTYQLREKRGLIYNISTFNEIMRYFSTFRVMLSTSTGDIFEILTIIAKVLKGLKTHGLKDSKRLNFFKESFLTSFRLSMSSEDYRSIVVGTQLAYNRGIKALDKGHYEAIIKGITNDDIAGASKWLFDGSNLGVVCIGQFDDAQALSDAILTHIDDNFV